MDIGEHCSFCGQIDFLPFKCACKKTFCMQHRSPEVHSCPQIDKVNSEKKMEKIVRESIDTSHLPSSKTLFPDRRNFKVELKTTETNPVTVGTKMQKSNKSALGKIKKFFEIRSKKRTEKASGPAKRMIEVSKLKTSSKGDSRVPATERIHVWVQVIDDESNLDKIERHPMFVSRSWPLGRALDSLATELKLKNLNNRTTDQSQRLFMFRETKSDQFEKLETSKRCNILKDGDSLFVVRGTEEPTNQ
ncbi:CYFA0S13e00276g1_1 [Cyberlindnera fabianii]|nr:CYFA0S13e00276g1_1 [Cyberlindnera fabianii]